MGKHRESKRRIQVAEARLLAGKLFHAGFDTLSAHELVLLRMAVNDELQVRGMKIALDVDIAKKAKRAAITTQPLVQEPHLEGVSRHWVRNDDAAHERAAEGV